MEWELAGETEVHGENRPQCQGFLEVLEPKSNINSVHISVDAF
jgi:hypothetical protein